MGETQVSPYRDHHHRYVIQTHQPPPFCQPVVHCECGHFPPPPFWIRVVLWVCGIPVNEE